MDVRVDKSRQHTGPAAIGHDHIGIHRTEALEVPARGDASVLNQQATVFMARQQTRWRVEERGTNQFGVCRASILDGVRPSG
jgi:hypothetical protein